ncbi:MAG: TonB-dependent receptor plug domain-containing protein [Desulfovibrio sp.]|jgi:iron complex outermembrane receptor protein|nr:TonB-dependent receptor plug domain-containing protein [Desulfovibrio sp.]
MKKRGNRVFALATASLFIMASCLALPAVSPAAQAADPEPARQSPPEPVERGVGQGGLTQGSLTAYTLPPVTVYGVADQPPAVPVTTRFGTQFNVVTEEQIALQNSLDFYDALRNVPGVMFQKKNIIGGQTSHSLYIRGRGAGHPSPDLGILFDDVPRFGALYGQALADGVPVYALGGMEIYKYPQPSRFGSGYGMVNFIPKYMTEEGYELKLGFEGGSFSTFAENVGMGAKKEQFDVYAAQSRIWTAGHVDNSAAWQGSWYGNLGVQLFEDWSLRVMSSYVSAQTEAPDSPLTGGRKTAPSGNSWLTDRYDTYSSLSTVTLANDYKQASGWLKGYYNDTKFFLRGEGASDTYSRQHIQMYGLRGRETFSVWEGSEFVLGFDLDKTVMENYQLKHTQRNSAGALVPVARGQNNPSTWDFPDQTLFSPYLAASQMFGLEDGFHVIPSAGLRLYAHNLFADKAAPQAGLVLGYGNTDVNFNYARGVNYPSPVVLQNFLGNKSLPSGFDTKEIKPEVVDHFEVGLTHKWPGLFTLGGTYFHDDGRDRTRAYMMNPSGVPVGESFFNTTSTARYVIEGVELSGSLTPVEGLELFAGATWLKARAKGDDGVERDKMPYTPEFAFQAGFKWDFLEHFRLSGDFQHIQGMYQGTVSRTQNPAVPVTAVARLTDRDRLPDINVLNLRLDYMFDYEPWHLEQGKLYVAVDNVLNAPYAYAMEKDGNTGPRDFYYMPGTTVMVGFELKF